LVAGSVPVAVGAGAAVTVALIAVAAVAARPWQGPLAVATALLCALVLVRHAVRRFGGITGDVIGAAVELATTVAYVVLVAGG
jgi:adenosylcobinamide-GDP ribazoletransferase